MPKVKTFKATEINTMISMLDEGYSFKKIGEKFNSSRTTIKKKLSELGYERKIKTKQCLECNKEFTPKRINDVKFCSNSCSGLFHRRNNKPGRYSGNGYSIKECVNCGEEFTIKYSNEKTCSEECKKQHRRVKQRTVFNKNRRKIKLYKYTCNFCGDKGYSKRKKACCSQLCRSRYQQQKNVFKNRKLKKCKYCNKWHYKERLYCSEECHKKENSGRRGKRIRLAKNNGQFDTDINIYKLIERDGERCYLCGDAVSFELDCYDPKYPTIEHVLAISNGGTHSWDNVKVSCFSCNCKKGTKSLEEFKEVS